MKFDISRDFLDGIMVTHPTPNQDQKNEIKAGGGLHFLPSSPDGKLHTAVAGLALTLGNGDKPFARGGWKFLFTTDEKFDPKENPNDPFLKSLLVLGTSKVMAIINPTLLHANLPLVPIDTTQLAQAASPIPDSSGPENAEA